MPDKPDQKVDQIYDVKIIEDYFKGYDRDFIQKIVEHVQEYFSRPRYKDIYQHHNDWFSHVNKILDYIGQFCKESGLNLNPHETNIIIIATILHDIGKSLYDKHPKLEPGEKRKDGDLDKLENAHHILSFLHIQKIIKDDIFKKDPIWNTYLHCAAWIALRHKKIDDLLFHLFKDDLKPFYKMKGKDGKTESENNDEYMKSGINYFEKETGKNPDIKDINNFLIQNQTKFHFEREELDAFSVLSALLQLGDNLDITKNRIKPAKFFVEVFLDDLFDRDVDRSHLLTPFVITKWYQFYYTEKTLIEKYPDKQPKRSHDTDKKNENYNIKITICYKYPENMRDDFLFFRYKAEKDFDDLAIISILEKALRIHHDDEDIRITLTRIENKEEKKEDEKENGKEKDEEKGQDEAKIKSQYVPGRIKGLSDRKERMIYCLNKICSNVSSLCLLNDKLGEISGKPLNEIHEYHIKKPAIIESCELIDRIQEALKNTPSIASHPDWREYSFGLKINNSRLLCPKAKNIPSSIVEYREKLLKDDVMIGLSRIGTSGLKEWKDKTDNDRKNKDSNKPSIDTSKGSRYMPASLDIAYLLNLFRHLRDESLTLDDIKNISGMDRGRILKYCGWLERDGYLILDIKEESYKINLASEKYSIVEKVLKEFDLHRSELVSRIRDIERFGKPLALYAELDDERIKTNIKGLDTILAPFDEDLQGLPLRKSILLLGPPGSGKTTLSLEIVRQVRLQRLPDETALYLTFEGDIQQLSEDFRAFGWKLHDFASCVRSLSTLQSKTYLEDPDRFFKHILNILDEFSPDLVVLDNLGYFLQLVPTGISREVLNRLIRLMTVRGITSILIGEDIHGGSGFEPFDVDGIFYLHYKNGQRWIEITKLRGRNFAGRKHPFKINDLKENETPPKPVIEVFPNIQTHLAITEHQQEKERKRKEKEEKEKQEQKKNQGEVLNTNVTPSIIIKDVKPVDTIRSKEENKEEKNKKNENKPKPPLEVLRSGVDGLDELLPLMSGTIRENGFQKGEFILVQGSPGAGKTVLGLHFLKAGIEKKESMFWVSFESDISGLKMATRSFSELAGFGDLIKDLTKPDDVRFKFYPPAKLNPDEMVNDLLDKCNDKCKGKSIQRLVIDSVTDVEQAFESEAEFKSFMTSLAQVLRAKEVTVMFLYRTRNFFGKSDDVGRVLSSVVDTIICLKVLEIQNAVQKGLFLLKVRGREHKSRLLSVEFKEDKGMIVSDRGWTMSGLISGESGEIKEPRVSVKLFFENRNESLINALIVKEYNRRFTGGQTNFVHVRKPQIYSEFWSFKGSSGAGHSNVRVVSLCDYWATLFHSQEKLYDLGEYVSTTTKQLVHREEFWRRCSSYSFKKNKSEIFSIPNYIDVGVLVFHEDIVKLKSFWKLVENSPISKTERPDALTSLTWNAINPELDEKVSVDKINKVKDEIKAVYEAQNNKKAIEKKVSTKKKKNKITSDPPPAMPPQYLFAMPALEERAAFVSFFLEIYWSLGGVVFDLRQLFDDYASECYYSFDKNVDQDKFPAILFPLRLKPEKVEKPVPDTREKNTTEGLQTVPPQKTQFPTDSALDKPQSPDPSKLPPKMQFIAEMLMLVPERIINKVIRKMNWDNPNFISDICRHGEILLEQEIEAPPSGEKDKSSTLERISAVKKVESPAEAFFDNKDNANYINTFLRLLYDELYKDPIWGEKAMKEDGKTPIASNLLTILLNVNYDVESILKNNKIKGSNQGENEVDKEQKILLIILFFVVTRLLSNRERYNLLLDWRLKKEINHPDFKDKDKIDYISNIIRIKGKPDTDNKPNKKTGKNYAKDAFEFLFRMVDNGISPNPHFGDFSKQAYLSRRWTGDVAQRPEMPKIELLGTLDLHTPAEAYEVDKVIRRLEKTDESKIKYGIAPLPSYDRKQIDPRIPMGKWSYSVMGLWSLGITKPALSPEIGWIFIDALTEDRFVEMRARRGLGLPAKVAAYNWNTIWKDQIYHDIYGSAPTIKNERRNGIVQYYDIATEDKPLKPEPEKSDSLTPQEPQLKTEESKIFYKARERSSIPFYFQVEEILGKELSRFFEPSFFEVLCKDDNEREQLILKILDRIHNRIKNFLIKHFDIVGNPRRYYISDRNRKRGSRKVRKKVKGNNTNENINYLRQNR